SVQIHPRPPLSVSPGRPTASKEGRIEPQPFTTCVGGTARLRFGRASAEQSCQTTTPVPACLLFERLQILGEGVQLLVGDDSAPVRHADDRRASEHAARTDEVDHLRTRVELTAEDGTRKWRD